MEIATTKTSEAEVIMGVARMEAALKTMALSTPAYIGEETKQKRGERY